LRPINSVNLAIVMRIVDGTAFCYRGLPQSIDHTVWVEGNVDIEGQCPQLVSGGPVQGSG
jgi:hypothetical protein